MNANNRSSDRTQLMYSLIGRNDMIGLFELLDQNQIHSFHIKEQSLSYCASVNNVDMFKALVKRYGLTHEESEFCFARACMGRAYVFLEYGFTQLGWDPNHTFTFQSFDLYPKPLDWMISKEQYLFFMKYGAREGGDLQTRSKWVQPTLTMIFLVSTNLAAKEVWRMFHSYLIE